MQTLFIALGALVGYLIAYHTYGRWLARKVFQLNADAAVPSVELNDDRDYVPTDKSVLFGHHFTSIAGTGPIVGPAIAVMWGWLPALLWVLFGSILVGAVHDFGSLVVSMRSRGQTVGDVAGRVLNKRVRLLFLLILFMALTIVLAIFGLVIASVFRQYPASIIPCLVQIPIAVGIGVYLHRKGVNLLIPSIIALTVMYLTVIFGNDGMLGSINATMAGWSVITWVVILLIYSYVASVLPVWMLLQPRDYINSLQLISALGLVVVGLFGAAFMGSAPPVEGAERLALNMSAPAVRANPEGAPLLIPFLFITIACGACSGFHCLVSSGTSSKQIKCETDAQFVGYGSMLTEGFLATLVILACVAGLGLGSNVSLKGIALTGDATTASAAQQMAVVYDNSNRPQMVLTDGSSTRVVPVGEGQAVPKLSASGVYEVTSEQYAAFSAAPLMESSTGTGLMLGATAANIKLVGASAYNTRYHTWNSASGLGAKVGAFVDGSANFLTSLGIPSGIAIALMGVLVASFAGTTLDTACRLQRYVIQELAGTFVTGVNAETTAVTEPTTGASVNPLVWLTNKHGATVFAVILATAIAALPGPGKEWSMATAGTGGLILWPLFGATNQLLAGLAFLVISFFLWRRNVPVWFIVIPMIFMLIMPAWAMLTQLPAWISPADGNTNWVVVVVGVATLALEAWMIVEAALMWPRVRGILEEALPPLDQATPATAGGGPNC